jgi:hypothetical protein
MKTASFFTYEGPGRISIARAAPRSVKGYRVYPALAPRHNMLKMPYEQYRPLYFAILERLDPHVVWDELRRLAEPHEPVLLCWERPPLTETNWCHRTMVSEWLREKLGTDVSEM